MTNRPSHETRLAGYRSLESFERHPVHILAVSYEPLDVRSLVEIMGHLRLRWRPSGPPSQKAVRGVLELLTRSGVCVRCRGRDRFAVDDAVIESIAVEIALNGGFQTISAEIERRLDDPYTWYRSNPTDHETLMRRLRAAVYGGKVRTAREQVSLLAEHHAEWFVDLHPLARICGYPFHERWFSTLPFGLREDALWAIVTARCDRLEPLDDLRRALAAEDVSRDADVLRMLQTGDLAAAEAALEQAARTGARATAATLYLRGDDAGANQIFDMELKRWRGRKKRFQDDVYGLWHLLSRLAATEQRGIKRIVSDVGAAARTSTGRIATAHQGIGAAALARLGDFDRAAASLRYLVSLEGQRPTPGSWHDGLPNAYVAYLGLAACLVDPKLGRPLVEAIEKVHSLAEKHDYAVTAQVAKEALGNLSPSWKPTGMVQTGDQLRTFIAESQVEEGWRRALSALGSLADKLTHERQGPDRRLAWMVTVARDDQVWFDPKEQKRRPKGQWTAGRPVAWQRLCNRDSELDYLTNQDQAMISCASFYRSGYYGQETMHVDHAAMLAAAVGHPHLFLASEPDKSVDIVSKEIEVEVGESHNGYSVTLSQPVSAKATRMVVESPTRIAVTVYSDVHRSLDSILGSRLLVPKSAERDLRKTIASLASLITVRSDLPTDNSDLATVEPDTRLRVRIWPAGGEFRMDLRVRPLGAEGPVYPPGAGGKTVIATIDGHPLQTVRQRRAEREAAWELINTCPPLLESPSGTFQWRLSGAEACLSVLLALEDMGDHVAVEWPEGKTLPSPRRLSPQSIRGSVRKRGSWFEVSADVVVDESRVLPLKAFLELLEEQPGPFIELGPDMLVAITEALRRRCRSLATIGEPHKDGIRVGQAAAGALGKILEELDGVKRSTAFRTLVQRLSQTSSASSPVSPTFRGVMRGYQSEGFRWALDRANLGFGVCLADEMGLGKTIQALAMLLARAPDGPALVVAPTSVCPGWVTEAARFAPTLQVKRFGATQRQEQLDALGPFDVLVTSYGLLVSERDRLADVGWRTLVLDEAQAIKNPDTQRAQAARSLTADFKLVTTGTPIENNLVDLWSLMGVLNPGLLGTRRRFERQFVIPIEQRRDQDAKKTLRSLVGPFILRRLKTDVLDELPPRTDVTIRVELSDDEMTLYEALRRSAVEKIDEVGVSAGDRRFLVLAELTKLRQACCHPRLVVPRTELDSSKMTTLLELVEELLDGGHRALIFSQFVGVLSIVRQLLEDRDIQAAYLDGSTPARKREEQIAAFQRGDFPLFLISLRAGGVGLNLTAADYVIHLDPWWNPAVEDQASDRAHRIGQTRPVTIYRLVAKGTVEERIVALHRDKRELAEGLLAGTDTPQRLDVETLVGLLAGTATENPREEENDL